MCALRHLDIFRDWRYGSTIRLGGQILSMNLVGKTILVSAGNRISVVHTVATHFTNWSIWADIRIK
jgi:hypothetical protein